MIGKTKVLALTLLVMFALGAAVTATASAAEKIFDTEPMPTFTLTGTSENTQVFTREPGGIEIKCTHVRLEGAIVGVSVSEIELHPEYTTPTCSGPLGSEVHVDFTGNDCAYKLVGSASKTATGTLKCDTGSVGVLITPTDFGSSICTITMPPQEFGGHVVFTNITENGKGSVTAESTLTGITSTRTGSSVCGPEHAEGGALTGNSTITSYTDTNGTEGEQTNLEIT